MRNGVETIDSAERPRITRTVGVVHFSEGRDRVLLFRHGPKSRLKEGIFGLPAGRLEDGETELVVAVRELREETGLKTSPEDLIEYPGNLYYGPVPLRDGQREDSSYRVFVAYSAGGQLREENDEGVPVWVDVAQLGQMPLLLNTHDIVITAQRFLARAR